MALPRIGFNEGSLLRRTLLHVGAFVIGSSAFIGVVSFTLVSVARGAVAPHGEASDGLAPAPVASAAGKLPVVPVGRPMGRPAVRRLPVGNAPPSKDD